MITPHMSSAVSDEGIRELNRLGVYVDIPVELVIPTRFERVTLRLGI